MPKIEAPIESSFTPKRTLRGRVFGAMFLIAALAIVLVAFQGYRNGRVAVVELTHLHLISVIEARSIALETWFSERAADIEDVACLSTVALFLDTTSDHERAYARDLVETHLDRLLVKPGAFDSIFVYDSAWKAHVRSGNGEHLEHEVLNPEFQSKIEQSNAVQTDFEHLHDMEQIGFHVGSAIRSPDGRNIGYVVANLNLSQSLNPLLQERTGLWDTGKLYITSKDLRILSEPFAGSNGIAFRKATSPAVLTSMEEGDGQVNEYVDYLGHPVLGAAVPISIRDWILVAELDTSEAFGWLGTMARDIWIAILIVLVLVLLLSGYVSRLLGLPLKRLAFVAHRIREGNLSERLEEMPTEETEEVRQAFNQMLDELDRKQREIARTSTLVAIGELSTSVAHEMRNPLSSIKMNLQSFERGLQENAEERELAQITFDQVERMERMLTDLLQFGKPIDIQFSSFCFRALGEEILRLSEPYTFGNDVTVELEPKSSESSVYGDQEYLTHAMLNLVLNAIDASPSEGRVMIGTQIAVDSSVIELFVLDQGPGVDSNDTEKLFEPFYSTKRSGTGLGLPNVAKISELHGGHVKVENRLDGGTKFSIVLPVK